MESQAFDDQYVGAKTEVAAKIMANCISTTKDLLEQAFQKPSSYYNGEKGHVLEIAKEIFKCSVTPEDIERLAQAVPSLDVVNISEQVKPDDVADGAASSSDSKIVSEGDSL